MTKAHGIALMTRMTEQHLIALSSTGRLVVGLSVVSFDLTLITKYGHWTFVQSVLISPKQPMYKLYRRYL